MKIEIKRDTVCAGVTVHAGQIIDASGSDARLLMALGKAVAAPEKSKKPVHRDDVKRSTRKAKDGY